MKIDLKARKFSRLLILHELKERTKSGGIIWACLCSCGNISKVNSRDLIRGNTRSCGCLRKDMLKVHRNYSYKHGGVKTRLYRIWGNMKTRCYNPNYPKYKYYGKKGIQLCDEWKDNFIAFRGWALVNGYQDNLTIDRLEPTGGYEPSNCQWITNSENSIKSNKERKR